MVRPTLSTVTPTSAPSSPSWWQRSNIITIEYFHHQDKFQEVEFCIVHNPIHNQTWTAQKGQGAFCDGKRIKVFFSFSSVRGRLQKSQDSFYFHHHKLLELPLDLSIGESLNDSLNDNLSRSQTVRHWKSACWSKRWGQPTLRKSRWSSKTWRLSCQRCWCSWRWPYIETSWRHLGANTGVEEILPGGDQLDWQQSTLHCDVYDTDDDFGDFWKG